MKTDWSEIMTCLSTREVTELDVGLLAGEAPEDPFKTAFMELPTDFLAGVDEDMGAFGVRVRKKPSDVRAVGIKIVGAAMSRSIFPVIVSHVHRSGFEQYGFRIEHVHASSGEEAELQEAEICAFWRIALMIDLEDLTALR